MAAMRDDPFSGDIAHLKGEQPSAMRRRVGDWWIFFDVYPDRKLVVIVGIRRRTSTTS